MHCFNKKDREILCSRPRICVITDGGPLIGMGHIQQSTTLAKVLQKSADVSFLTKSGELIVAAIRDSGFEVCRLSDDEQVFAHLQSAPPDVVLFDKIDVSVDLARKIRSTLPSRLVIFTNLTEANTLAHMVVLQRAPDLNKAPSQRFRNEALIDQATGTLHFYGPRYWVLRPEFQYYQRLSKKPQQPLQRILLTFGGSDPTNLTSIVLDELLNGGPPISIDVMLGRHFNHHTSLAHVLKRFPAKRGKVTIHHNVNNVAELMHGADLTISAAGMTMFESLCVRTPIIVIPQDNLQRDTYQNVMGLLEANEIAKLPDIIKREDFSTADDPIIASMEIGEGLIELVNSIITLSINNQPRDKLIDRY